MSARTFAELRDFAARAAHYAALRAAHPTVPARTVHLYLTERIGDPGDSLEQATCRHSWSYTGTAYGGDDDSYHGEGRALCAYCGKDGDG